MLEEIAEKYGTDKKASGGGHGYTTIYEKHFEPRRMENLKLLEIGIQEGKSIRMWEEYFPNAEIYGIDISPEHVSENFDRAKTALVDQGNREKLEKYAKENGPWDIIIDDGSHRQDHMRASFFALFPHVKNGGSYCIEDTHCCYLPYWNGGYLKKNNMIEVLKRQIDELQAVHWGGRNDFGIKSLEFYVGLAIIGKV